LPARHRPVQNQQGFNAQPPAARGSAPVGVYAPLGCGRRLRYENRSATIVTTNRGLPAWAELFGGDAVVAAAILDRLLDGAAVINIKGGSWRLREHQALTQPLAQLNDAPERPLRKRR